MTHRVLNIHKVKGIIHLLLSLCLCLLSTLFVLTLPMHVLRHWQSIARMFLQNHCGYEEDGFIGSLHDVTIYVYVLYSWLCGCWELCVLHIWNSEIKSKADRKKKWKWNMKSFSNEILDVFFSLGRINFGSC